MASPQTENGYTRISNELLEAFYCLDMPDSARRVFLCIVRKTYGYGKKQDRISASQLMKETRLSERRVWEALAWLKENKMLDRDQATKMTGIVKDYTLWAGLSTGDTPADFRRVRKNAVPPADFRSPSPLRISADTKERDKRNLYKRKAAAVENSKNQKGKRPHIEGDPAWQDPRTKQWRVQIHTGEWVDYVGNAKPEWR